jgi:hypothetical protein
VEAERRNGNFTDRRCKIERRDRRREGGGRRRGAFKDNG